MKSSSKRVVTELHPAQRFVAPASIQSGHALKTLIGPALARLIAESIADVYPKFDARAFQHTAEAGLDSLELKQRGAHVADALRAHLPSDFPAAAEILIKSMGPVLAETEGNGLATFFYFPHTFFIATAGLDHFDDGMRANLEVTQRFTAEFSVQPFIERYPKPSLKLLKQWARHENAHVRRLVSEGTRPRLPWAPRLRAFSKTPEIPLALLDQLKDDPEQYVRRSVANHLGDLLKDEPELIYATCERWIDEVAGTRVPDETRKARHWIIRHAVRLPAKKGEPRANRLRQLAGNAW